jgi:hypothetical protein
MTKAGLPFGLRGRTILKFGICRSHVLSRFLVGMRRMLKDLLPPGEGNRDVRAYYVTCKPQPQSRRLSQ